MRGVLLEIFKRTPFFGFISMYCSDKYFVACVKRLLLPFQMGSSDILFYSKL